MKRVFLTLLTLVLASLACGQYVTPTPEAAATVSYPAPQQVPPSPTPTVPATAAATEAGAEVATVRAATLNVRQEPCDRNGENCGDVIGQVQAGTDVRVIACGTDPDEPGYNWCEIEDPAGFVFIGCLSIAEGQGCSAK